jgi:hypothetical protein
MNAASKGKPITIVGGGLAGLTLGIGLRQKGIPVTVWESGHYPRHRVCGEFLSGRGLATLRNLGLSDRMLDAETFPARTAMFLSPTAQSPVRPLPGPAVAISRYVLDGLLATIFQEFGGELLLDHRWKADFGEGIVRATGRRAGQDVGGLRWFGIKFHARNVSSQADVEMHASRDAYVGITRLGNGKVNVCALVRRVAGSPQSSGAWKDGLRGTPGSLLSERLAHADLVDGSYCSVAGLALEPHKAANCIECCLGDALTMIPPVTGNGMSMAFEAARLAIEPLAAFSSGSCSWVDARRKIAHDCDAAFKTRLTWAQWLQWMMFAPIFRGVLGIMALNSYWLWRLLFARTR